MTRHFVRLACSSAAATFLCVASAASERPSTGPSNDTAGAESELITIFQGETERKGLMFRDGLQRRPHIFIGTPPIRLVRPSQVEETVDPANSTIARPTGIRLVRPTETEVDFPLNTVVATPTRIRFVLPSGTAQTLPANTTIANPTRIEVLRETDS